MRGNENYKRRVDEIEAMLEAALPDKKIFEDIRLILAKAENRIVCVGGKRVTVEMTPHFTVTVKSFEATKIDGMRGRFLVEVAIGACTDTGVGLVTAEYCFAVLTYDDDGRLRRHRFQPSQLCGK